MFNTIDGWDQKNVVSAEDILAGKADIAKLGPKVIVWDAIGYDEPFGIAEMLADAGKTVDVRTSGPFVGGQDIFMTMQFSNLFERSLSKGVKLNPMALLTYVNGNKVGFMNSFTHEMFEEEADTVVFCVSKRPNDELFWKLKEQGKKVYRIGDANSPHNIGDAVYDGHILARQL